VPTRSLHVLLALLLALLACAIPRQSNSQPPAAVSGTPRSREPAPTPASAAATPPAYWQPRPGLAWQWQIDGEPVDTSGPANVYDLDLHVEQEVIDALRGRGAFVICYISVGSWEDWRPDAHLFPKGVLGRNYDGWEGERWLDIRQINVLAPIMRARLDLCAAKGFAAVEPDNMEVTGNDSGFPIGADDEARYARWLAVEAHARGLAIGMKNAAHLLPQLLPYFDFIVTEDCFAEGWCEDVRPFVEAGKPVYAAEYTDMDVDLGQLCAYAAEARIDAILKNRGLDAWVAHCP
jgi:hypothetical protein